MPRPWEWVKTKRRDVKEVVRTSDLARAGELIDEGEYEKAEDLLRRRLGADPDDWHAKRMLRQLPLASELARVFPLWSEGRTTEAEQVLHDLAERFPDEPEPHLRLAAMAVERGDDAVAVDRARRAIALEPHEVHTLVRAAWWARRGDPVLARAWTNEAKELAPGTSDFRFAEELLHVDALLAWSEGRQDEALVLLRRAFDADPGAVGVALDLVDGYAEHGRVEDARSVLAIAQEHRPDDERLRELHAKLVDFFGAS